ncbi:hypothetical protein MKW92_012081 [Papaver armeniacum]|nr:hypothetical protein MKW92_012081 [Papaver armeniacum]
MVGNLVTDISGNAIGAKVTAVQYASDVIALNSIVQDIYSGCKVKPGGDQIFPWSFCYCAVSSVDGDQIFAWRYCKENCISGGNSYIRQEKNQCMCRFSSCIFSVREFTWFW